MDYTKKIPGIRKEFFAYVICPCCHRTGMVRHKREPGKFTFIIHSDDDYGQPQDVCDIPNTDITELLKYRRLGSSPKPSNQSPGVNKAMSEKPRIANLRKGSSRNKGKSARANIAFERLFVTSGNAENEGLEQPPLSRRLDRLRSQRKQE